jgi:2,4-dienoyl-CoA reductase-like NADH-dependent reductase (Old Yellow Enzyme family)
VTAKFTPFENTGKHDKSQGSVQNIALFQPYTLKSIELKNRVVVPPMCTYSAKDGMAEDFHINHYGSLGRGGAGLVIVEATAVSPEGRISPSCLGIWNDEQAGELAKVASAIKLGGSVPGIQLGHAGRKANANEPWNGDDHIPLNDPRSWQIVAPSAVAFGAHLPKIPKEMTIDDIHRVQQDFKLAAKRASDAGFEWLELHFAHGYLAQTFFSTHSNKRTDEYGVDFNGRIRFIVETIEAIREVWPIELPLTMRFGVLEYDGQDEQTLKESITMINLLKEKGLDLLNVSVGFTIHGAKVPWGPGFLANVAKQMKDATNMPIASAWGLGDAELANQVVENDSMDLVMIGRAYLANPHYTYEIARTLKHTKPSWVLPTPYAHWLERYK